jgi:cell shape-determining protein MreD
MKVALRTLWVLLLGVSVLVMKTSWLANVVIAPLDPLPLVPMVVFLAIAPNISVARGVTVAFVLGYLGDVFQGTSLGLEAFMMSLTFVVIRTVGSKFILLRNIAYQSAMAGVAGALVCGGGMATRAIFEPPVPLPLDDRPHLALTVLGCGLATGLVAPLFFEVMRRIEALYARREEGGALA